LRASKQTKKAKGRKGTRIMTGHGRNRSVHNWNVIMWKHHAVFTELGRKYLPSH